jgi:hypothetical protein
VLIRPAKIGEDSYECAHCQLFFNIENETEIDDRQSLFVRKEKELLVGILSPEAAAVQDDFFAFNVVAKSEAAKAETVLPFSGWDMLELLDRMPASSIVRILAKNACRFFVSCSEFLMLFA